MWNFRVKYISIRHFSSEVKMSNADETSEMQATISILFSAMRCIFYVQAMALFWYGAFIYMLPLPL